MGTKHNFIHPIPNDRVYYLTNSTLSKGKDKFTMHTEGKGYHFPKAPIYTGTKDPTLVGYIEIKPVGMTNKHLNRLDDHELYNLYKTQYEKVYDLDDSYADILDCITILWGEKATHLDSFVEISVDDILRLRDKKHKANGQQRGRGYHPKQREAVADVIWDLAAITVSTIEDMHIVPGANRTKWTFSIINIASEKKDTEFSKTARITFKIKLGDLFAYRILKNRQTALIDKKLLHLDRRKYWVEKRIGRYLTHLWRIRHRDGSYCDPIKVGTILDEIALDTRYKNGKTYQIRERFETAMDKLEEDGVIGQWSYDVEDPAVLEARGISLKDYREWQVEVIPPDFILDHYRKIKNKVVEFPKKRSDNLGEQVREARKVLGMNILVAADEIGISSGTLSKVENGGKPGKTVRTKIEKWLKTKGLGLT